MRNPLYCSSLMLWFAFAQTNALPFTNRGVFDEAAKSTFHSRSAEVRLLFFATDQDNRPVDNLQQNDFAIVDNEQVIRNFRSFSRAWLERLDVVVLIDSSESVQSRFPTAVSTLLQLTSQWPSNPETCLSVLSFSGTDSRLICSGEECRSLTAGAIASVPRAGATPLFDALERATTFLAQRQQPETWPLIILFSDGEDTISRSSFRAALDQAVTGGIQIYSIDLNASSQTNSGSAILRKFADDTGGRYIRLVPQKPNILNAVLDDLHTARLVTYAPPASNSDFHTIRILPTHNLNLNFRSRRGYYRAPSQAY